MEKLRQSLILTLRKTTMKPGHKKNALRLLLTVLTLAIIVSLLLVVERVRGKIQLVQLHNHLASRGESISSADLEIHSSPEVNGAPMLAQATEQIASRASDLLPGSRRLTSNGTAIAGFRKETWASDGKTLTWTNVSQALTTNAAALELAREALKKPLFDNHIDHDLGPRMKFDHMVHSKKLAHEFGASAMAALHEGQIRPAAADLISQVGLLRTLENDHVLISELVRVAVAAIASLHTWEALPAEGWTDDDLSRLYEAWAKPSFIAAAARALEGERVFAQCSYALMRKSNNDAIDGLFWMQDSNFLTPTEQIATDGAWSSELFRPVTRFLRDQVYCRVWRFAWLDQSEARYLSYLQASLEAVRRIERHKNLKEWRQESDALQEQFQRRSWHDKLIMPGYDPYQVVGRGYARVLRMECERQLILAALALKRYELRHQRLPESLEQLVPEFISGVPADYMSGQPLRYLPHPPKGYLLYSIGEDGIDDGGDGSARDRETNLLWDRKDMVWPREATPRM